MSLSLIWDGRELFLQSFYGVTGTHQPGAWLSQYVCISLNRVIRLLFYAGGGIAHEGYFWGRRVMLRKSLLCCLAMAALRCLKCLPRLFMGYNPAFL